MGLCVAFTQHICEDCSSCIISFQQQQPITKKWAGTKLSWCMCLSCHFAKYSGCNLLLLDMFTAPHFQSIEMPLSTFLHLAWHWSDTILASLFFYTLSQFPCRVFFILFVCVALILFCWYIEHILFCFHYISIYPALYRCSWPLINIHYYQNHQSQFQVEESKHFIMASVGMVKAQEPPG